MVPLPKIGQQYFVTVDGRIKCIVIDGLYRQDGNNNKDIWLFHVAGEDAGTMESIGCDDIYSTEDAALSALMREQFGKGTELLCRYVEILVSERLNKCQQ